MSRVRSPFQNTVMGGWLRPPGAAPESEPVREHRPAAGNGSQEPNLARWLAPAPAPVQATAIVQRAFSSKVFVVDEVDLPPTCDSRLVVLREPDSTRARSYRLLRHRLLAHGDPRVISVTSAEPGEGKTTTAVNLALALADETMARVLLVEANLRRPALGMLFGYEPSESFVGRMAEYRDATPPYAVAAILGTRLQVAALPPAIAAGARLDRTLFSVALHELRDVFDYVVIDAAAMLESADADVTSGCADGAILTVRAAKSTRSAVRRAVEQLAPARIFGTVLLDG